METAKFLIHSVCHSSTLAKNKSNKAAGVSEGIQPFIKINKFSLKVIASTTAFPLKGAYKS